MSDLGSINLLLATMDLKMVQSVLGAMHRADAASAASRGTGTGCPGSKLGQVDTFHPSPRFESRVVYHPTPRYEARRVFHPESTVTQPPAIYTPRCESAPACPAVRPVWNALPEVSHPMQGGHPIKKQVVRPDIRHKGSLIDTFI